MIRKHWFEIVMGLIALAFVILAFTGHIHPSS